jgi:hypothetical protein
MALVVAWLAHGYAQAQVPQPAETHTLAARHRVLIITDSPGDPFMNRVQAELGAIPELEVTVRAPMGSLDAEARAERAQVAIRKAASGKGVEVWMADATSGRSLLRQLVIDESPNGPDQGLVALQTAELLRTALMAKPTPSPPAAAPPPTTTEPPWQPAPRSNFAQAGLGPLWSRGGVGPSWQAWLGYQHLLSRHWGLSLEASAPVHRGSISSTQGSAEVGGVTATGGLLARLESEHGHLSGTAPLGAGMAAIAIKGKPSEGYVATSTTSYAGLAYLRLGGGWNPIPWLGLGASVLAGTTTSRVRIQFAGRTVGDWGTPLLAATVHAEIDW